ncbi:MAG: altronate dehydratase family protein [Clostridiales bacterium]|nr:altronate dehydratase family protein [Clostridiales bacterium]
MEKYIKLNNNDNVVVAIADIKAGEVICGVTAAEDIARGHKMALVDIPEGENVIKYGYPIGHTTENVSKGKWIHSHNLKTNLSSTLEYTYNPKLKDIPVTRKDTFMGYVRKNGEVGIRNEIWIVNTVGCVNGVSNAITAKANERFAGRVDGIHNFVHPYGCSQLGEDHENTQKLLAGMVRHPNAAGVLVLSLGCENNNVDEFKKVLGDYDPERVRFVIVQEHADEIEYAFSEIEKLVEYAEQFKQEEVPVSKLVIGLKCGGSDGLSGITANPLIGRISDIMVANGGRTVLSEVPEMFGAETILMDRCQTPELFDQTVSLVNNFKEYFLSHGQPVGENPSPGNKKGGITTLEDKSLGCTQKGGTSNVQGVLLYGDKAVKPGLNLLQGPGNDIVAISGMMASGCHLILFSTGRGTPVGSPVPTVKIATNSDLAGRKPNWIDWNAGRLVEDKEMDSYAEEFFSFILDVASHRKETKNEINGYREIAIFKNGVTL